MQHRLRLLRRMTPRRVWNLWLLWASYHGSRILRRPLHWGMPLSLSIEPTTSCNLRCPECPSGLRSFTRPTGMLQPAMHRSIIDQVSRHASYLTFYFQGEPFLNRGFLEMVQYAASRKMITATSTNAHYLDEATARATVRSGLDQLIISIDGTTQEVYEQYRIGGNLEKVLEGTRNMVRIKKEMKSATPHIIFQFLVVAPNEHQVQDVLRLADELGVDEVRFKTAQVYDYKNGHPLIPANEKYSRYKKMSDGKYRLKNRMDNQCWRMWSGTVITWDGKVVPCCFDKDAQHQLGDMQRQSFAEIWKGAAYRSFRQKVLTGRSAIDICSNCSEGTRVWA